MGVEGLEVRGWCLGFKVADLFVLIAGGDSQVLGFGVKGLWFRVSGKGVTVQGLGVWV